MVQGSSVWPHRRSTCRQGCKICILPVLVVVCHHWTAWELPQSCLLRVFHEKMLWKLRKKCLMKRNCYESLLYTAIHCLRIHDDVDEICLTLSPRSVLHLWFQ